MNTIFLKRSIVLITVILLSAFTLTDSYANTSWFYPVATVKETYDDNIFLSNTGEIDDLITTISPGFMIQPELNEHEFQIGYVADLEFFNDNSGQNTKNHSAASNITLNFTDWRIEAQNLYRYFENRIGTEDTLRIPRTTNDSDVNFIYAFNKLDLKLTYAYQLDNYRSNLSIGDFQGQALTYPRFRFERTVWRIRVRF